jgi:hypothetical protein
VGSLQIKQVPETKSSILERRSFFKRVSVCLQEGTMGALISRNSFALPKNVDQDASTLRFLFWLRRIGQMPKTPALAIDLLENLQAVGITSIACRLESTGFVIQLLARSRVQYEHRASRFYDAAAGAVLAQNSGVHAMDDLAKAH